MTDERALKLARECAADALEREGEFSAVFAADIRAGFHDDCAAVQSAIAAIKLTTQLAQAAADAKVAELRKAADECTNWSPAQGERLRAKDAVLDVSDTLANFDHLPADGGEK